MDIRILKTSEDFTHYDAWLKGHPHGNIWQSLEWKSYQEAMGREVRIYIVGKGSILASALVVIDRTTGGFCMWDVPRGPIEAMSDGRLALSSLLERVVEDARKEKCIALYLSPPHPLTARSLKLIASPRHEQPEATRIIDLTKSEEGILAQMHPKGRYNIKVAQKNGVHVEESRDIDAFYNLLEQTAERDGFQVLPLKAYKAFLERLSESFLLMAYGPPPLTPPPCGGEGNSPSPGRRGRGLGGGGSKPIAGLLGTVWGQTGIYYYGASDYVHRAFMAPYALQWEAMRLCKSSGCAKYDLLGVVPPVVPLTLPSPAGRGNTDRGERELRHPWAGVSAFKEKFGGSIVTYPPEQQIVLRPMLWKALQWKRRLIG